ncbi:MAG: ribosome maturation factor RimP [Acidaminococcaceae bacterium]|nr:ribosome maturation factor RimP [Acidaminococcaceae bacterium]
MQRKEIEAKVVALVEPLLNDTELTLVDVEYVCEKDKFLRIYIDKPGGIEIDDCQLLSEKLTEVLDEKDPIPEKYYLEVSSPGIDRPLKRDEDFLNAYGTKVDIVFSEDYEPMRSLIGVLENHDENIVNIRQIIKGKESKNTLSVERKYIAIIRPHIDF